MLKTGHYGKIDEEETYKVAFRSLICNLVNIPLTERARAGAGVGWGEGRVQMITLMAYVFPRRSKLRTKVNRLLLASNRHPIQLIDFRMNVIARTLAPRFWPVISVIASGRLGPGVG